MIEEEETAGAKTLPHIFGKWKQMDRGMISDLDRSRYL